MILVYNMFLLFFLLFFLFFPSQAVEYFSKPATTPLLSVFWSKRSHFSSEVMMGAAEDPSAPGSPLLLPLSAD